MDRASISPPQNSTDLIPVTSLNFFPDEILLNIHAYLYKTSDLIAFKRTCPRFYKISFNFIPPRITPLIRYEDKLVSISVHNLSLGIFVLGSFQNLKSPTYGAIYNLKTGKKIKDLSIPYYDKQHKPIEMRHLIFDPSRKLLIAEMTRKILAIWNIDGSFIRCQNTKNEICSPILHYQLEDLQSFKLNTNAKDVELQPASQKRVITDSTNTDLSTTINRKISFDAKRKLICTSSEDKKSIKFLNFSYRSQKKLQTPQPEEHLYLANCGELIYLNCDNKIVIYNFDTSKEICKFSLQNNAKLTKLNHNEFDNTLIALTVSPDEVESDCTRQWITIWDLSSKTQLNHFMASAEPPKNSCYLICCMLKLPRFFIAGTNDGTIVLWNLDTQKIVQEIEMKFYDRIDQISMDLDTNKLYVTQKSCTSVIELPFSTIKL
jgi:WD40 repeat protein